MKNTWLFNRHLKDGATGQSGGLDEVKRGFKIAGKDSIYKENRRGFYI